MHEYLSKQTQLLLVILTASAFLVKCAPSQATSPNVEPAFVPEPQKRGTIGLLLSSIITYGLCVWTSLHGNLIPHAHFKHQLCYKVASFICALLFPEFLLLLAIGQLSRAVNLHDHWKKKFPDTLGLEGGFFVVMGGYTIQLNSISISMDNPKVLITLTPAGFKELVDKIGPWEPSTIPGRVKRPNILRRLLYKLNLQPGQGDTQMSDSREPQDLERKKQNLEDLVEKLGGNPFDRSQIIDKAKADSLSKVIVIMQTLWFLVHCCARKLTGKPITLIELRVAIQVCFSVFMYCCWWYKPQGVAEPISLRLNNSNPVWRILNEAKEIPSSLPSSTKSRLQGNEEHAKREVGQLDGRSVVTWHQGFGDPIPISVSPPPQSTQIPNVLIANTDPYSCLTCSMRIAVGHHPVPVSNPSPYSTPTPDIQIASTASYSSPACPISIALERHQIPVSNPSSAHSVSTPNVAISYTDSYSYLVFLMHMVVDHHPTQVSNSSLPQSTPILNVPITITDSYSCTACLTRVVIEPLEWSCYKIVYRVIGICLEEVMPKWCCTPRYIKESLSSKGRLRRTSGVVCSFVYVLRAGSLCAVNGILHGFAWDSHFPSPIEKLLWRYSCIGVPIFTIVGAALAFTTRNYLSAVFLHIWTLRFSRTKTLKDAYLDLRGFRYETAKRMAKNPLLKKRSESDSNTHDCSTPTWEQVLLADIQFLCCTGYTLCFAFFIVEAFISVRSLPKGAYDLASWTQLFVHM